MTTLEILKDYINTDKWKWSAPQIGRDNCIEIIDALKKQVPMKPMNKKYSFYTHSTLLKSKYGECPICGEYQADDEYCQHCGQKLDWSD